MKNKILVCLILLSAFVGCKKDTEESNPPGISFTHTSSYTLSIPAVVTFTAASPNADNITWDFGDGTSAFGFNVQHSFTAFGNYKVKATAFKSGLSASQTKDVPVTFFRRAVVKEVEVLQIPTYKAGGIDWDPGTMPDLSLKITFPGDTVYESPGVLNNVETGVFNIVPPKGSFSLADPVTFGVYDVDVGNVPDRELIGAAKFKFCDVLPDTTVYTDSVQISSGALRLRLKFEFQL